MTNQSVITRKLRVWIVQFAIWVLVFGQPRGELKRTDSEDVRTTTDSEDASVASFYETWKVTELAWYHEQYFVDDSAAKEMQQGVNKLRIFNSRNRGLEYILNIS